MRRSPSRFLSSERGSAAAEHALIVAIIVLGLGAAMWALVDAVSEHVNLARDRIAAVEQSSQPRPSLTDTR